MSRTPGQGRIVLKQRVTTNTGRNRGPSWPLIILFAITAGVFVYLERENSPPRPTYPILTEKELYLLHAYNPPVECRTPTDEKIRIQCEQHKATVRQMLEAEWNKQLQK